MFWFDFWIIWVDSFWTWRIFLFLFFVSFTELFGKKSGNWPNFQWKFSSYILSNSHRTQKWIKMKVWNMMFLSRQVIFRFNSNFQSELRWWIWTHEQSFLKEKTHWTETSWRHHTDTWDSRLFVKCKGTWIAMQSIVSLVKAVSPFAKYPHRSMSLGGPNVTRFGPCPRPKTACQVEL